MPRGTLLCVLLLTIAAIALPLPAGAEERIALVVGNGAYPSGPLSSSKTDADAVAKKLTSLGFAVTKQTDLRGSAFRKVIRDFGQQLEQTETVGVFYYSGHGMQVNNRNYMIPIDAEIRDEVDVEEYGVPIENVVRRMEVGKSNPNIIILDACRNNPFEKRLKSPQDGLAPIDTPAGTLIAFAAAAGKVAVAGLGGKLSSYTQALIEHIDQPYTNVITMFQAVQNVVYQRSGREQSPRLEIPPGLPDFSFKPVVAAIPSPAPVQLPAPLSAQPGASDTREVRGLLERMKAVNELRQMADAGDPAAQTGLATAYLAGIGVDKDDAEAARLTRLAADQGFPPAEYDLALLYFTGRGVPKNVNESAKWLEKAAAKGIAPAQNNLGLLYAVGQGVPKDMKEAASYFRKAADQGFAEAQNNLGVLYANGDGVKKDPKEAKKWFDKAAAQGHSGAQSNLKMLQ